MTQVNCLIVDDEELARELLEAHLSQFDGFKLIASCASAIDASKVLNEQQVDLMFLDIEMPVLKGTEFYKNLVKKPKVIFTTAYRDYAVEGFELEAIDYLLKPIVFSRFFKAIERFKESCAAPIPTESEGLSKKEDFIFVREDRRQVKIWLADVLFVQGLRDYVQIHTHDGSHIVKETMTSFAKTLGHSFMRVHRSYIVNQNRVTAFTSHDVEIGDVEIPIGESYRPVVKERFR